MRKPPADSIAAFYALFPLRALTIVESGGARAQTSGDPLAILEMTAHAIRYLLDASIGEELSLREIQHLTKQLHEIEASIREWRKRGEQSATFSEWQARTQQLIDLDLDRLAAQVDALPPRVTARASAPPIKPPRRKTRHR